MILFSLCACSEVQPPRSKAPVAFETPALNAQHWQQYRDIIRQQKVRHGKRAQPLLESVARFKAAAASHRALSGNGLEKPRRELELQAWQFVQHTTPAHYFQLGRQMAWTFVDTLESRIRSKRPLMPASADATDSSYLSIVGDFPRQALDDGWRAERLTNRHRCMFIALYLREWIAPVSKRLTFEDYWLPQERYCELRWRVEYGRQLPLEERLNALDELARQESYPAAMNRIILVLDSGDTERAQRLAHELSDKLSGKQRLQLRERGLLANE